MHPGRWLPPTLSCGSNGLGRAEVAVHFGANARAEHGGAALLGPERGTGLWAREMCVTPGYAPAACPGPLQPMALQRGALPQPVTLQRGAPHDSRDPIPRESWGRG